MNSEGRYVYIYSPERKPQILLYVYTLVNKSSTGCTNKTTVKDSESLTFLSSLSILFQILTGLVNQIWLRDLVAVLGFCSKLDCIFYYQYVSTYICCRTLNSDIGLGIFNCYTVYLLERWVRKILVFKAHSVTLHVWSFFYETVERSRNLSFPFQIKLWWYLGFCKRCKWFITYIIWSQYYISFMCIQAVLAWFMIFTFSFPIY